MAEELGQVPEELGQEPIENDGIEEEVVESKPQAGKPKAEASGKTFDEAYVKRLRDEAAKARTEKQELALKVKQYEDEKLTETERKDKRLKELEEANTRFSQNEQALRLEVALEKALLKEAARYPKLLLSELDKSGIEYDPDTNQPTKESVARQIEALKEEYPDLFKGDKDEAEQAAAPRVRQPGGQPSGAGTNAPRLNAAGQRWFYESEVTDMEFFRANEAAILQAAQEGRIRPVR